MIQQFADMVTMSHRSDQAPPTGVCTNNRSMLLSRQCQSDGCNKCALCKHWLQSSNRYCLLNNMLLLTDQTPSATNACQVRCCPSSAIHLLCFQAFSLNLDSKQTVTLRTRSNSKGQSRCAESQREPLPLSAGGCQNCVNLNTNEDLPKALETASTPPTLQVPAQTTTPPALSIRCRSSVRLGLWSSDRGKAACQTKFELG